MKLTVARAQRRILPYGLDVGDLGLPVHPWLARLTTDDGALYVAGGATPEAAQAAAEELLALATGAWRAA